MALKRKASKQRKNSPPGSNDTSLNSSAVTAPRSKWLKPVVPKAKVDTPVRKAVPPQSTPARSYADQLLAHASATARKAELPLGSSAVLQPGSINGGDSINESGLTDTQERESMRKFFDKVFPGDKFATRLLF